MQRLEQHDRIDVALMVRAVHHGAIDRGVSGDAIPDAGQTESKPRARVSEHVQEVDPSQQQGEPHADRGGDQDEKGNGDEGQDGSNSEQ